MALGFSLLVTLVTGLAIGLLPALAGLGRERERDAQGSQPRLHRHGPAAARGCCVAEVSLSLVLLIAAGLLLTSFARLQRVEPGFEPEGVFTAQLVLPPQRYDRDKLVAFYEQFYQRLVDAARQHVGGALTDRVPLTGGQTPAPVAVVGRPVPPMSERPHREPPSRVAALLQHARHSDSRRARLRRARQRARAARRDRQRDVRQAALPRRGSDRPHADHGMGQLPSQIVGVVADVRSTGLNTPPEPDYFLPALQRPETFTNILVRTTESRAMAPLVREALRTVDPDLPLLQPQALSTRIAQTVADRQAGAGAAGGIRRPRAAARQPRRLQRDGAPRGLPHERDRAFAWRSAPPRAWSCGWCSATAGGSRCSASRSASPVRSSCRG